MQNFLNSLKCVIKFVVAVLTNSFFPFSSQNNKNQILTTNMLLLFDFQNGKNEFVNMIN